MRDLRGFIALCRRGYLGVITGMDYQHHIYYGYRIDDLDNKIHKTPWESKDPHVVESLSGLHAKAEHSARAFDKNGVEI